MLFMKLIIWISVTIRVIICFSLFKCPDNVIMARALGSSIVKQTRYFSQYDIGVSTSNASNGSNDTN